MLVERKILFVISYVNMKRTAKLILEEFQSYTKKKMIDDNRNWKDRFSWDVRGLCHQKILFMNIHTMITKFLCIFNGPHRHQLSKNFPI